MIVEDQSEVIAFLSSPSTYGDAAVERIETHSSVVFLAGERALKLKRAVRYAYLDFSTVERRKTLCEAEVRINRRAAPAIYRRAFPVTRERDGHLALDGTGPAVDWLVEMRRFSQNHLFDRLAARDQLPVELMTPLAASIARFHAGAEPTRAHGGKTGMAAVVQGNADDFRAIGRAILDPAACDALTVSARAELDRCGALLDRRRDEGFVRRCHGDLHLRNIVLLDGEATLFDAIEFNDDLACVDVLYDLSFLLMDLWHRGLQRHANEVLNGATITRQDIEALRLLPLFLSTRAAVRAKTSATAASLQAEPSRRREQEDLARRYLDMAAALLRPVAPSIVAIGGLSGTGKTTLARALAPGIGPVPGAVVVRSDETRKRLMGVSPLTRLGADAYAPAVTRRVYEALAESAAGAAAAGHSTIADAVFQAGEDRARIEGVAAASGVRFFGLWLDAPEAMLLERVAARGADASDADAAVVRMQIAEAATDVGWHHVDAGGSAADVLRQAIPPLRAAGITSAP